MIQILIGIILILLALQSKLGKRIMLGKRGIWLEDKGPDRGKTHQSERNYLESKISGR